MQNLPGWWVKKIWHSQDGWLLVAKKEEFNLLVHDAPFPIDQRNLVEETLSSESSMENQRQNMGANLARQALQHFLHLPEDAIHTRARSRSPRGNQDLPCHIWMQLPLTLEQLDSFTQMMKKLLCLQHYKVFPVHLCFQIFRWGTNQKGKKVSCIHAMTYCWWPLGYLTPFFLSDLLKCVIWPCCFVMFFHVCYLLKMSWHIWHLLHSIWCLKFFVPTCIYSLNFDLSTFFRSFDFLRLLDWFAMASGAYPANVGPMDAPWDTPDPLTSVHQLQGLVGHGYCVGHDSTGDLQALIQSALGGIRKEVDQHMDFLETEHVEHKTDHAHQRKMVKFWKCSKVTLHSSKVYTPEDTELEVDQTYYQWTKMQNLPGWWVKKVWHSIDGWLLVAKKEEYALLINDIVAPVDQRNLVEETLSSEGSLDNQRQHLGSAMARQALQHFLHLPEGALPARERSRSPPGGRCSCFNYGWPSSTQATAAIGPREASGAAATTEVEADMPQAFWVISMGVSCAFSSWAHLDDTKEKCGVYSFGGCYHVLWLLCALLLSFIFGA